MYSCFCQKWLCKSFTDKNIKWILLRYKQTGNYFAIQVSGKESIIGIDHLKPAFRIKDNVLSIVPVNAKDNSLISTNRLDETTSKILSFPLNKITHMVG